MPRLILYVSEENQKLVNLAKARGINLSQLFISALKQKLSQPASSKSKAEIIKEILREFKPLTKVLVRKFFYSDSERMYEVCLEFLEKCERYDSSIPRISAKDLTHWLLKIREEIKEGVRFPEKPKVGTVEPDKYGSLPEKECSLCGNYGVCPYYYENNGEKLPLCSFCFDKLEGEYKLKIRETEEALIREFVKRVLE